MIPVLIIDDDRETLDLLSRSLVVEGFAPVCAASGEEGLERFGESPVALILLDVMLPGMNGFETLRRIRRQSSTPVIMLTARGEGIDRVAGLETGADDYVPKPFFFRELVARMHAVLRRSAVGNEPAHPSRVIRVGSVELDPARRTAVREGQALDLTTGEFDLLRALMESAGSTVSREDLSRGVLGREHSPFDRGIDNLVSGLRRKLGPTRDGRERLKTVRNAGYVYVDLDRTA